MSSECDQGPRAPALAAPQPTPQPKKDHKGEGKEVLCDLQREAVSGPDAPPHPLHVAEEHDDAEEGEVAGDTYEGAGHREVVEQVPDAGRGWQLLDGTDLLSPQNSLLGRCKLLRLRPALRGVAEPASAPSPEPGEVRVDAEVGPVQLDALAVDLDDRSGGRHVLRTAGRGA